MPKQFIEKEAIVKRAYALAQADGLRAVNVRAVADACGVAVGSIYNYFPSKDDLVAAVVECFFGEAFFDDFCHPASNENFLAYCERLFESMRATLARFRSDWLFQIQSLGLGAREAGKKLEVDRLMHVRSGLEHVLAGDPDIAADAFGGGLDASGLCAFVLRGMMDALRAGEDDCHIMFALLEKALY